MGGVIHDAEDWPLNAVSSVGMVIKVHEIYGELALVEPVKAMATQSWAISSWRLERGIGGSPASMPDGRPARRAQQYLQDCEISRYEILVRAS